MIDIMAVKVMTAALLAVSGAAVGQYQASRLTRRVELLEELISGMRLFRNEIYYTPRSSGTVAGRLTLSCQGCGSVFFSEFAPAGKRTEEKTRRRSGENARSAFSETERR